MRLEKELQQPTNAKSNITAAALQSLGVSISRDVKELNSKQQELSALSEQVSFKQLYEAVVQVQSSSPEHCPACKTPLAEAAVNPYTHAGDELVKLQHLAGFQHTIQQLNGTINRSLVDLSQFINTCCTHFPTNNQISGCQVPSGTSPNIDWWNMLLRPLQDGYTPWQHFEVQAKQLEESDVAIEHAFEVRTAKLEELSRLREFSHQITILQTRRQTANQTIANSQKTINDFDVENAQLIADAEGEKTLVTRNQDIANAYSVFVDYLNAYKDSLPAKLVADLGEQVVSLYNAFNRNDPVNAQLASVRLPLAQNEKLEIAFQDSPDTFFDALHVLSEGHIRCMGLAILAAKNIKESCPLLIFDDPVNAIDDEHREAIRRTLFEDSFFDGKQIILTCHGEEFFKDIQNLLSAERVSQSKTLAFLPNLSDKHILVDFNCAPRNYIISAKNHLEKNEIRDALSKSRQALESLTKGKVWRYVSRFGDGNLSIKLRAATAAIELRNLTEQLKSKIAKADFSGPEKESILVIIETLLGINGDSREWRYLNKGTHEETDRAEFDRHTVQKIVTSIEQLDTALG